MVRAPVRTKPVSVRADLAERDFSQLKFERPLLDPLELLRIQEDAEAEALRRNAPIAGGSD